MLELARSLKIDAESFTIETGSMVERRLSDLRGCFADAGAYEAALAAGDPVVYSVSAVEPAAGTGDLHIGLGMIMPGKVGREYYLTKGHLHARREAAEIYLGLKGRGVMILEDEDGSDGRCLALEAGRMVYVPGGTAHRTVNVGEEPLVYLGIYPAWAGHDYAPIAERHFRRVMVEGAAGPEWVAREEFKMQNEGKA